MSNDADRAEEVWTHFAQELAGKKTGRNWWHAGPAIEQGINRSITGDPQIDWISYTLDTHFSASLPIERCLSLGCGIGHMERNLAKRGAFRECDALDLAEGMIQKAVELAAQEGFSNIRYRVADLNQTELPVETYNAVWVNNAMHHFAGLEHIAHQISRTLQPNGLLIIKDYIGPNRFQFSERQKELANICLHLLPSRYRLTNQKISQELQGTTLPGKGAHWYARRLLAASRNGELVGIMRKRLQAYQSRISGRTSYKEAISFPSAAAVEAHDPSEAVRSEEILSVLQQQFDIVEKRDFGGNILQFLLADIAGNFSEEDPISQDLLNMLISVEQTLLRSGEYESDFAYIVAKPRRLPKIL